MTGHRKIDTILDKEYHERNLLELYRAIKKLNKSDLVSTADVGDILEAYETAVGWFEPDEDYDTQSFQLGFVAAIGAVTATLNPTRIYSEEINNPYLEEDEKGHFIKGETGGVALEQGNDSRFVKQSGVHEGQNDE